MDLAGEIVQELCDFLNLYELSSTADFPLEFDTLQSVLSMVCCSLERFQTFSEFTSSQPMLIIGQFCTVLLVMHQSPTQKKSSF